MSFVSVSIIKQCKAEKEFCFSIHSYVLSTVPESESYKWTTNRVRAVPYPHKLYTGQTSWHSISFRCSKLLGKLYRPQREQSEVLAIKIHIHRITQWLLVYADWWVTSKQAVHMWTGEALLFCFQVIIWHHLSLQKQRNSDRIKHMSADLEVNSAAQWDRCQKQNCSSPAVNSSNTSAAVAPVTPLLLCL